MEELCGFCKKFFNLQWTNTTKILCMLPFLLFFLLINIIAILGADGYGAIVTDTPICVDVGKAVLVEGGSAVDAAIAAMFCEGVSAPKEIGLGGGFTALLYMNRRMESLIATPTPPANSPVNKLNKAEKLSAAKAGGIPGELLGYWEMHHKYGLLPWKRLISPSIKLAYGGIDLTEHQFVFKSARSKRYTSFIYAEAINNTLKLPLLGKTLEQIADGGADVFYKGELGEDFVRDVQADGGYLTMDDLRNFSVSWSYDVISFHLPHHLKAYTTPLPSSGIIVAFAMNILKAYKDLHTPVFWHRFVEASKHALGLGLTLGDVDNEPDAETAKYVRETYDKMLDMDFVRETRKKILDDRILNGSRAYGSSYQQLFSETSVHVSVVAPNGEAVSLTSSLLFPMSIPYYSKSTGLFWNDQMRGYRYLVEEVPPGRRVSPHKRFLMPHAPTMVFPRYRSRPLLTLGATGGPYMRSQVIMVLTRFCLFAQNIKIALNAGYLHPHMSKGTIEYDYEIPHEVLRYLQKVGHKLIPLGDRFRHFGTVGIGIMNTVPYAMISQRPVNGEIVVRTLAPMSSFAILVFVCLDLWLLFVLIRAYFRKYFDAS